MEIRLLSSLATQAAVQELTPEIEAMAKVKLVSDFGPTVAMIERVKAGETTDLAILTTPAMEALLAQGVLNRRTDVAVSLVGMAVRAGAPKPAIGTVEDLKRTLLSAKSVAYSKIGASGIFFAELLQRLGIAKDVHAVVVPVGFTATLLADGRAELAIQQISELLAVPNIDIVGPLPQGAHSVTPFSIGIFSDCKHMAHAQDVVRLLTSPRAMQAYEKSGLQRATH
jgi:molybdate transport system substrate-binding protein